MIRTLTRTVAVFAIAGTATLALAGSHGGDLPASVKARKAHMQLYGYNIGVLAGMARGNMDYDAAMATTAASNIAALSSMDIARYWEEGTDSDTLVESRALPAIWENLDDVAAKNTALHEAATAAAASAGDGLEAVQAGVGAIGKACGACHEDYQLPKDG